MTSLSKKAQDERAPPKPWLLLNALQDQPVIKWNARLGRSVRVPPVPAPLGSQGEEG